MSTTRKRTKAAASSSSKESARDKTKDSKRATAPSNNGRFYLRVFLGCLSVACFTFAALSYIWSSRANTSTSTPAPEESTERSESSKPSHSTRSTLSFSLSHKTPPLEIVRSADVAKQAAIKEAFQESWRAYVEDAFGADEYHPVSRSGTNFSIDGGVGYFIIDTLDMLLITGDEEEYRRARDWVEEVDWSNRSGRFSVFETTIRTLGGLLSAHSLCKAGKDTLSPITSSICSPDDSEMFLEKAVSLAEMLRPAFEETGTGIPLREVDFQSGQAFPDVDNQNMSSLAEVASIQLEFKYLAHATGDVKWWTMAERPMQAIRRATLKSRSQGLLPIFISPYSGEMYLSEIRLGSRGDSYYEYLIKQYIQTNHSEAIYGSMYREAATGIKRHLLRQSEKQKLLYTTEIEPRFYQGRQQPVFTVIPKQDHLVCFLGGSYMLGALHTTSTAANGIFNIDENNEHVMSYPPTSPADFSNLAQEDWTIGHELIRTCVDTYQGTSTGLSAEITMFRIANDNYPGDEEDWYIKKSKHMAGYNPKAANVPLIDARNILRPETVESLFIAFHLSGDVIYRQWGWEIFQAFVKSTRIKEGEKGRVGAFSSIRDVEAESEEIEREDRMETFWLAETLKYLYLLFSDQDTLRLDQWVLNTEAHPLPVFQPTFKTGVA